jgi:hypothetical protein
MDEEILSDDYEDKEEDIELTEVIEEKENILLTAQKIVTDNFSLLM